MLTKNDFSIFILNLTKNNSPVLADTMLGYGYKCISNTIIEDSYEYIKNNIIDLIIINTDNTLANEIDIIQKIKSISSTNIIFLSSSMSEQYKEEIVKLKLLDYKIKQNNIIAISSKIDTLVTKLILNKKETILVIKKPDEKRIVIENMLKNRGYNIKVAQNGAQGWKEIDKSAEISMILLTPRMNDMDSLEIITKAKRKFNSDMPVIALNETYDSLEIKEHMSNGFCDFIITEQLDEQFHLKIDLWIENVRQKREIDIQKSKLIENLNSFKALSNATIEGLIMFENNICVDANDEAIKLFKYENKEELIGSNILNIVPTNLTSYDKEQLLKNDIDHELEIEMRKKDDTVFPTHLKERNIVVDEKKLKIIAVLDMTDIKRKEHLLNQQSKMASMGEMMSNIAHQWRQPLTSISISASSIKLSQELDMLDENEIDEQMDNIIQSTVFLSDTINDFQNFLNNKNTTETFNVQDVVSQVLTLVEGNIKSHSINIIEEYQHKNKMFGIKNELIQSVLNIINNAKDALITGKDKVVKISTFEDEKNEFTTLSIHDSAGGIPKDIINKIFEPYFTTKHQDQGTGLGLYMTYKMIVDHMSGKLEVSNEKFTLEEKEYFGANFKITIPNSI